MKGQPVVCGPLRPACSMCGWKHVLTLCTARTGLSSQNTRTDPLPVVQEHACKRWHDFLGHQPTQGPNAGREKLGSTKAISRGPTDLGQHQSSLVNTLKSHNPPVSAFVTLLICLLKEKRRNYLYRGDFYCIFFQKFFNSFLVHIHQVV